MTGNVCVSCVAFALHTNRPVKLLLVSGRSRYLFLCSRLCVCLLCVCPTSKVYNNGDGVCVRVCIITVLLLLYIYLCTYILILTCSLTYSLTARRARYLIGGIYLESRRRRRWCRCRCVQCAVFAFCIIYYIIVLRNTSLL